MRYLSSMLALAQSGKKAEAEAINQQLVGLHSGLVYISMCIST